MITIVSTGKLPDEIGRTVYNDEVIARVKETLPDLITKPDFPERLDFYKRNYEEILQTTPESMYERLGVHQRQYCDDLSTNELGAEAAYQAIKRLMVKDPSFDASQIQLIYCSSSSPTDLYSPMAAYIHDNVLPEAKLEGMDLAPGCAGGLQAVLTARYRMLAGDIRYALVVAADVTGSQTNAFDSINSGLWGDGAAAFILRHDPVDKPLEIIIDVTSGLDGTNGKQKWTRSRGLGSHPDHRRVHRPDNSMEEHGSEIYRYLSRNIPLVVRELIERNDLPTSNKFRLIQHNSSIRTISKIDQALGLGPEQSLHRLYDRGNQSAASALDTYAYHDKLGTFQSGDVTVMTAYGAGLAWCALINVHA